MSRKLLLDNAHDIMTLLMVLNALLESCEDEAQMAIEVGGYLPMDDIDTTEVTFKTLREARRLLELIGE